MTHAHSPSPYTRLHTSHADMLIALLVQGVVFNEMRSKTKVIQKPITSLDPKEFPDWSFDGSSTGQAEGNNSDCILKCAQTASPFLPVQQHAMCHT